MEKLNSRQSEQERTKELENSKKELVDLLDDYKKEKVKAEQEQNKTVAIITNLTDGLLVFDEEKKLSLVNPQAKNFFKVKSEQIINKHISELASLPQLAGLANLLKPDIQMISRKELIISERLTVEVSSLHIENEGKAGGFLVIVHDVTREKLMEKMKSEFVSLTAHQLRTPLSAMKWSLKMLLDGDLGQTTQKQKDFIEKTYNTNERIISLINDILNVNRIEEGKYLFRPMLTDIEPIIQLVIDSYKEEIKKKKIKFKFKRNKENLPKVEVDVAEIKLAIENFLENALRYTLSGGEVTITLSGNDKEIEFKIQDSGIGIPEDQKNRVFTKFFRAANVEKIDTEGSGLGLHITKNIIESHGGKIWFESVKDKGSIFYFTLPAKEEFTEFLGNF